MKCPKCGAELPDGSKFCHFCGPLTKPVQRRRGKGEGSVYRRGRTWEAAVVLGYRLNEAGKAVPDRRTKGGFKTKKEALAYLPELRREKKRTVPTVEDLWNQFQQGGYKKITPSRQEKYRIAWPKLESIRYTRIDQLTTADLQAVVSQAATYYPARDIRDLLSKLYQLALPDQFVSSNLADFLVLPDKNEAKQDAFTAEEIQKLWNHYAADNWWTGYILLMCYTGMMPGELLSARKDMVDLKAKTITGAGKKTAERKAVPIVLADVIIPVLEDLMQHTQGDKLIRINKDRFYKVYYEAVESAGCRRLPPVLLPPHRSHRPGKGKHPAVGDPEDHAPRQLPNYPALHPHRHRPHARCRQPPVHPPVLAAEGRHNPGNPTAFSCVGTFSKVKSFPQPRSKPRIYPQTKFRFLGSILPC